MLGVNYDPGMEKITFRKEKRCVIFERKKNHHIFSTVILACFGNLIT
jgi:hypothetical protein